MKRRNFLSTLTAAGLITALKPAMAYAAPPVSRISKQDLYDILQITEVPGIAISGIVRGRPVQQVEGLRVNRAQRSGGRESAGGDVAGSPIELTTYFPAASLTKPLFAWAVLDLIRQGKLELRKPLQEYMDLGLTGEAKRITAQFALTHTTGLPNWRFQPDTPLTAAFMSGSRWQYSGEGIFLLQRVVEKIVGVPIGAYMKEKVLKPLGMTSSTFAWSPELQARAVSGHDRRASLLERSSAFYEKRNYDAITKAGLQPESSTYEQIVEAYKKSSATPLPIGMSPNMAGSLWTTPLDYPKFLKAVLSDIPRHPEDYLIQSRINPEIGWSLGWGVDETFGPPREDEVKEGQRWRADQTFRWPGILRRQAWFHWGDGPGFKNFCWIQPDTQTALVIFTNGDHGQAIYSWVFRKLVGDAASLSWI
ncbi:MAG TPA: serine hydrolase [Pyrinomonadaceae bacterium]|nr:serine hydrolase [Pyrinomonadaceae bacterium]